MKYLRLAFQSFFILCLLAFSATASATLKNKTLDYSYGGKNFKGYLAWDDAASGKRPGILVVHEWWGLNDYARSRADQLAKAGYVAFAADMYGDGKVATHPDEAGKMAGEARANIETWLGRANAALQVLRSQPNVDPEKLAAIGYCFGGATVLQLAYNGSPIKLVASFHGALFPPEKPENIKTKILVFQGGKDPFVSSETLEQVQNSFHKGKVDAQITIYPDALHGFTVPGSETRGIKGVAYNAAADQASWQALMTALRSVFGK